MKPYSTKIELQRIVEPPFWREEGGSDFEAILIEGGSKSFIFMIPQIPFKVYSIFRQFGKNFILSRNLLNLLWSVYRRC